jgi:enterochelin esterase family protein
MIVCLLALIAQAKPITPTELNQAMLVPVRGAEADELARRVRAAFPPGTDLKLGKHAPLVQEDAVAFVLEALGEPAPRVAGMVNHGRGLDMLPIGQTGLWVRVDSIPADTKFSFDFRRGKERIGGRTVEMPRWQYLPESSELPGRSYGKYLQLRFRSEIFHNERTGWIYLPAAYDPQGPPPALMVFQDGDAYRNERVGTVVDNLIAAGQMPVTILLLLNPGINEEGKSNRSVEYDTLSDAYVRFLEREAVPQLTSKYKVRDDAASRAIAGASSGAICAFTVAWNRPDLFGRVCSQIGSFTNIRGGDRYPQTIAESPHRPIKVVLTMGTNDLINPYGDWWRANEAMYNALKQKGYDVFVIADRGFHAFWTCGRQLPEAIRRTWAGFKP